MGALYSRGEWKSYSWASTVQQVREEGEVSMQCGGKWGEHLCNTWFPLAWPLGSWLGRWRALS